MVSGMYRYGRAQRYTAFQAFDDDISTHQPRVVCERKTFLDTLIILLQSRHNIAKIWSLRGVWCPTALHEVCKCRLTTSRYWRPFILPHKNENCKPIKSLKVYISQLRILKLTNKISCSRGQLSGKSWKIEYILL